MAKKLLPVDAAVTDYMRNGVESAGLTYREIAAQTGMSINRIGIILRKEPPPATVGEISSIARTFGMKASDLIAEAEASLPTKGSHGTEGDATTAPH